MCSEFHSDHRGLRGPCFGFVILALILLSACGQDEAQREAMAAAEIADHGGPMEEQIAHYDRAIELAPERSIYWESRAGLRMSQCDNVRALADIDRAIELADRPYLRFKRGLILCRGGRIAEALPEFDLAIAQQPENAQFYRGRALARLALGQVESALEDTRILFSLSPNNIYNFYARGIVLTELGRFAEAIRDLDLAVQYQPDAIYPLRARAACHKKLGNSGLAAMDRERADKLERSHKPDHRCDWRSTPYK